MAFAIGRSLASFGEGIRLYGAILRAFSGPVNNAAIFADNASMLEQTARAESPIDAVSGLQIRMKSRRTLVILQATDCARNPSGARGGGSGAVTLSTVNPLVALIEFVHDSENR